MAITMLVSSTTPDPITIGAGGDYDKAMAQLTACKALLSGEQMLLTEWTNVTTMPKLALGSYLQHLGAIYKIDTDDYTIPTPASDGTYYVLLTTSGDTLTVSTTDNLAGFSWNAQYNGCYNASDVQVLPYQLVISGTVAVFAKRKIQNLASVPNALLTADYNGNVYGASLHTTGVVTCDTLVTAGGASVGTDLDVTGTIDAATINTGQGDNELYGMDQPVKTSDNVTFNSGIFEESIRVKHTNLDHYTGAELYTILHNIIGDITRFGALDGVPVIGTFYLADGTTQCIASKLSVSALPNKYYLRYQAIGSTDTISELEITSTGSTIIMRYASIALIG